MSEGTDRTRWPIDGEALLVDDDPLVRESYTARLAQSGCTCHGVESYESAEKLLQKNGRIDVVVMDHGVQGQDTEEFVTAIRRTHSRVMVVGSSGRDCRDEFQQFGVSRFLRKPWSLHQLFELITNRISVCALCGISLPLRRPMVGEEAASWVCAFCGARYRAVLDHDVPADICLNVRASDYPK